MKHINLKIVMMMIGMLYMSTNSSSQNNADFLMSPKLIKDPGRYYKYSSDSRKFTGISSLAVTEKGTMWAVWYAGATPGEDNNNYVVVANSMDNGTTWKEVLVIDPDESGPVRAFDPEVWIDPNGKLWIFWAQGIARKIQIEMNGKIAGVWAITTNSSNLPDPEWSDPQRLTDGIMMCKPTVLKNGEWVLPVSTWWLTENSAKMVVSDNQGKSWTIKGSTQAPEEIRTFDEHMIVEKNDGSLWMWIRTKVGIGESFSKDGGKTWSEMKQSDIIHSSARFFIRRLNSGNLLLIKQGSISERTERSHLMAFISQDDGETWSKGLLIDGRSPVSYPDGQQTKDGTIYITYDYSRMDKQHIYMTSFREEDILTPNYDDSIIRIFNNRKLISKGGR